MSRQACPRTAEAGVGAVFAAVADSAALDDGEATTASLDALGVAVVSESVAQPASTAAHSAAMGRAILISATVQAQSRPR